MKLLKKLFNRIVLGDVDIIEYELTQKEKERRIEYFDRAFKRRGIQKFNEGDTGYIIKHHLSHNYGGGIFTDVPNDIIKVKIIKVLRLPFSDYYKVPKDDKRMIYKYITESPDGITRKSDYVYKTYEEAAK